MKMFASSSLVAFLVGLGFTLSSGAQSSNLLLPPPMPMRTARTMLEVPLAEKLPIPGLESQFTLYLPDGWQAASQEGVALTLHFHNADNLGIQEHVRRGMKGPLLAANLGVTSTAYGAPFQDAEQFGRLLEQVEEHLKQKNPAGKTRITAVDITTFGAGYGAVREILKSPESLKIIRRLVLTDSFYASYSSAAKTLGLKKPDPDQINPWTAFAKEAVKGEKTFVITFSELAPGTYAGPEECVAAILESLAIPIRKVQDDDCAAANVADHPLIKRADSGHFHAWGYAGTEGPAHFNHTRYLADIWQLLDQAGKP